MELYIFRHGQTVWNKEHKIQGSADIELTDEGRALARKVAEDISDIRFDAIYSSPLMRAYETACILRGDRALEIVCDDRIREMDFGVLEGKSFHYIHSEGIDPRYSVFFSHPEAFERPQGGESMAEVCARAASFIDDIRGRHGASERIMIVAHGTSNKAMMKHLRGLEMKDFWYGGLQKNCAAMIVSLDGERVEVIDEGGV